MNANGAVRQEGTQQANAVSLEQFAGVETALAVNLPIADILAQEKIDPDVWPQARRAWREIIATSMTDRLAFMKACGTAEDALARKIDPLDRDPSAWLGLLAALAKSDQPDKLLVGLGLTSLDVGVLGRLWQRKAKDDPELATKMGTMSADAKAPASVVTEPLTLRPFPWSPISDSPSSRPADAAASENPPEGGAWAHDPRDQIVAPIPQLASFQKPALAPSIVTVQDLPAPPVGAVAAVWPQHEEDVDRTALPLPAGKGPVLPFKEDGSETLMISAPSNVPLQSKVIHQSGAAAPDENADETLPIQSVMLRVPITPFHEPPRELSLEQYIELRARLNAGFEDEATVWAHYGFPTPAARDALRNSFSRYFQTNPTAQRTFLESLIKRVAELKQAQDPNTRE